MTKQLPRPQGDLAIPPRALKKIEVVERVRKAWSEGYTTTSSACKQAKVARSTFYLYMEDPYVQQDLVNRLASRRMITDQVLESSWVMVLMHMVEIASGRQGDPRAAVQAARFLRDVEHDIGDSLEKTKAGETGPSVAKKLLDKFQGVKATAHLKETVREIEMTTEDTPEGEIVEGEVSMSDGFS
mgnify:CR=1 FL=1